MIKWFMGNLFERFMTDSIYRLYPEREWIPHVSSLGTQLRQRIESYRFDLRLLDVEKPTLVQLARTNLAYARYYSFLRLDVEAKAWARAFFEDCYFLKRADAEGYFYAIFFPRYCMHTISQTMKGCLQYFRQMASGDKAPLQTTQLCLAVFYTNPTLTMDML
jgi:hypothetical protein